MVDWNKAAGQIKQIHKNNETILAMLRARGPVNDNARRDLQAERDETTALLAKANEALASAQRDRMRFLLLKLREQVRDLTKRMKRLEGERRP